jgi:aldehyde:ferredoxin oxidoreductase
MGAAAKPTWIDIRDGAATLRDATNMWGLDTFEAQAVIYKSVLGSNAFWDWNSKATKNPTTQRPAILAIGPIGEAQCRIGSICSESGSAFGQGGFGGVWGSKNLKAISVLGTGSIQVADNAGLLATRQWTNQTYATNVDNPVAPPAACRSVISTHFAGANIDWNDTALPNEPETGNRGCWGCHYNCRARTFSGLANGQKCAAGHMYVIADQNLHGKASEIAASASEVAQRMGINMFPMGTLMNYLVALHKAGWIGQGASYAVQTDLDFSQFGNVQFVKDLLNKIAYKKDIGADLVQGEVRAAKNWGRLDQDLASGLLNFPHWGYRLHSDPRTAWYWGYMSIMSDREVNTHDMSSLSCAGLTAKAQADIFAALPPYYDADMTNYNQSNAYSISMARMTAWMLHYSRFWKQSCGLCDECYADFSNPNNTPSMVGLTPIAEPRFFQNVSGTALSFIDSMELGRKIYNLDKAIWVLQGRHRDMEVMAPYIYSVPSAAATQLVRNGTTWASVTNPPFFLDKTQFENWKTLFLQLEGWDTKTGWPTRATLEGLGLKNVADTLQAAGKLGR